MDRSEILVVITVLELLDQSKPIPEIERAYERAVRKLDRYLESQNKPRSGFQNRIES